SLVVSLQVDRIRVLESNATSGARAGLIVANELNTRGVDGIDNFGQGADHTPDNAVTCFHSLDRGVGDSGEFSELTLINPQESTGAPHLRGSNHSNLRHQTR